MLNKTGSSAGGGSYPAARQYWIIRQDWRVGGIDARCTGIRVSDWQPCTDSLLSRDGR